MELIVIDDRKLKIMLTPPDMRHYDLRAERMSAANADTRRAFRHIFDDARDRIGFDTAGERLLVQLYTSRGGGCEIFVTKLGADEETADGHTSPAAEDALLARLAKEDAMVPSLAAPHMTAPDRVCAPEVTVCRFAEAEVLFALCRRMAATDYTGESAVYIDEGDVWYLFLTPAVGAELPVFLREYAAPVDLCDPDTLALYLSEHGRGICAENAVARLGKV